MKIKGSPNGRVRLRDGDREYAAWFDASGYAEVSNDVAVYLIAKCAGVTAAGDEGVATVVEEVVELPVEDEADEPEVKEEEEEVVDEDVEYDIDDDETYTEEGE